MVPSQLFVAGNDDSEFIIEKSLRFSQPRNTSLHLDFPYPHTQDSDIYTKSLSFWYKRGILNSTEYQCLFAGYYTPNTYWWFGIDNNNRLYFLSQDAGSLLAQKISNIKLRDISSHYHIMLVLDLTNAIAEERIKIYVNGERITSWSTNTNPSKNAIIGWLSGISVSTTAYIGGFPNVSQFIDGYISELHIVDGLALTPHSFGKNDNSTNSWVPIKYDGTYGNNGFYLDFKDNVALDNLGYDKSGNGHNLVVSNFSITAGYNYDSMDDTPSNNFPTFCPLKIFPSGGNLFQGYGNLIAYDLTNYMTTAVASILFPKSGKWYFEVDAVSVPFSTACFIGVTKAYLLHVTGNFSASNSYRSNGAIYDYSGNTLTAGSAYVSNDIIGIEVDVDNGEIQFYKNGVSQGANPSIAFTPGDEMMAFVATDNLSGNKTFAINFGQYPYAYGPSTPAFKNLCSNNLPVPVNKRGDKNFKTVTYIGNGGNLQVGEYKFPRFNYLIDKSLRFKGSNSYLSRMLNVNGSFTTNSISLWFKRTDSGIMTALWSAGSLTINGEAASIGVDNNNKLFLHQNITGSSIRYRTSTLAIKSSDWFHLLAVLDTTNVSASLRFRMWLNGIEITQWDTNVTISQNQTFYWNSEYVKHVIGSNYSINPSQLWPGYIAEVNFIDGQALGPENFGEFDANGYWIPKAYIGIYGQNGFYLDFEDNDAVANLGYDKSGNNNHWTPNNFSLTAGVSYDSMTDTPTNIIAILDKLNAYVSLVASSGLYHTSSTSGYFAAAKSTLSVRSGKWYAEMSINQPRTGVSPAITGPLLGITSEVGTPSAALQGLNDYSYTCDGYIWNNNSVVKSGLPTATVGDIIQLCVDLDAGKLWFGKNGSWMASGNPLTGTNPTVQITQDIEYYIAVCNLWHAANGKSDCFINFGQQPFVYTQPTGYKELTIPNIAEYTYDLETPDLVLIKCRNSTQNPVLFDSIRGTGNYMYTNLDNANAYDANSLIQFNKNGFYIGNNPAINILNNSYVAWMWKASQNQLVNNDGTIQSTVRVNVSAGFSVVQYTGTGTNASVGHGLGIAPDFILAKNIEDASTSWAVQFLKNADRYMLLNDPSAQVMNTTVWQGISPDSSVFNIGTSAAVNSIGKKHMAYCFSSIEGYSKIGYYVGNGDSNGPFFYCGFRPTFIMIKRYDVSDNWDIWDTERSDYNPSGDILLADSSNAEASGIVIDILSNGFKIRIVTTSINASGGGYIVMAFAENPFKYSNAK